MRIDFQHTIYSDHLPHSFFVSVDGEPVAATLTYEQDQTVDCRKYTITVDGIAAVTPDAMAGILEGARKAAQVDVSASKADRAPATRPRGRKAN